MANGQSLPIILHVAPIGNQLASGPAQSVPRLVQALKEHGATVGLLTTSREGIVDSPQSFPVISYRSLKAFPGLQRLPPPFSQPDLIVFHSTYIPIHAVLAREAVRHKIPYIITPRGGMTHEAQRQKALKKKMGNHLFFNNIVRHAVAIHCLTDNEAEDAQAWRRPVFVVGNGIDLPDQYLARPGHQNHLRFVFIGRYDIYHKGLDLLLKACIHAQTDLRRAGAYVELYGPSINDSRQKMQQIIDNHMIQDIVHIHNPIYCTEKAVLLGKTDVFVHTSRFEGHPMAVLEALAYGIPCLLTPGSNMASAVTANGAGWQVDANPEAIANGIKRILAERKQIAERGAAARMLAESAHSWDKVAQQLIVEYQRILHGHRNDATT